MDLVSGQFVASVQALQLNEKVEPDDLPAQLSDQS